ncbi:hypothetical protein D3C87_1598400 [compost metagenome]
MADWPRRLGNDIKVCCWVHINKPFRHSKTKDLVEPGPYLSSRHQRASALNSPNELQHVTARNIRDRKIAQTRKHVLLQVFAGLPRTALLAFRQLFTSELMPTISNRFKRVVGGVRGFLPLGTTMRSGIDIIGHQRTCSLSPLTSLL